VEAGREPSSVERSINLSFALSTEDVGVMKAQLHKQWGPAADRIISGSVLGRPEDAMEQISAFVEAGAQLVNIAIRPPWNQELLAEYVENVVPQMKRHWG
jgi:alkanesulfonate monooxygenase SsuD/methylene tetrahydromethanopterin reductase-like flavin-dependent oxidoreductase (luciferase family)